MQEMLAKCLASGVRLHPMKLADYLEHNEITLSAFAKVISRSEATVSRIAREIHRPDWATIDEIERATAGLVSRNDFGSPPPDPAEALKADDAA